MGFDGWEKRKREKEDDDEDEDENENENEKWMKWFNVNNEDDVTQSETRMKHFFFIILSRDSFGQFVLANER